MTKTGEIVCCVLPGGGMAGAFTMQIIKIIHDQLMKTTGKGFHDYIDAYFCTSTGSIIGGSLVAGMSVDQVYDFYMEGEKYFKYDAPWWVPNKWHVPRYKREPILTCLLKGSSNRIAMRMGDVFKNTGKHIMFSTVNKNFKLPLNEFIKSWNDNFCDMRMIDAIARSFAASIYFGNINDDNYKIVFGDGGEGDSNNPILEAYASICGLYPESNVRMLNIGTGYFNEDEGYEKSKKKGDIGDAMEVLMMARGQATKTAVYWATRAQKRDKSFKFYHIDGKFQSKDLDVLDGIKFIPQYKNLAIKTMDAITTKEVLDFIGGV